MLNSQIIIFVIQIFLTILKTTEAACPPNCYAGYCNATTGQCGSCKDGFWGPTCSNSCPSTCQYKRCDMKVGTCFSCQGDNFWGDTCQNQCPQTCQYQRCNMKNGTCSSCQGDNYWGPTCDRKCPEHCQYQRCSMKDGTCGSCAGDNYWGPTCSNNCSVNCHWGRCNFKTGACGECQGDAYWGPECDKKCSPGCHWGQCNYNTGCCSCADGWFGNCTCSTAVAYDFRKLYPACASVSQNFDQGACNSCWAASALSSLSDRFCMRTGGKVNLRFSVEQLVSCSIGKCVMGIAYDNDLSNMLTGDGVPTENCRPYTSGSGSAESCNEFDPCKDGSTKVMYYASSVKRITPYIMWSETELAIRTELSNNGPVWAEMQLGDDDWAAFINYKSGSVFSCNCTTLCGFHHTIKIIGYGNDPQGGDYWLIWNPSNNGLKWGDQGVAKIKRGPNGVLNNGFCSIQASVYAAEPKLEPKIYNIQSDFVEEVVKLESFLGNRNVF